MDGCEIRAYAKINLGLDVIGTSPDGYHVVRMIMQTVGIYDELIIEPARSGILLSVDTGRLSAGHDNLIYRAAQIMTEEYHIPGGVSIRLKKKIPISAGMGGGSADAAAVLKGMNDLFGLGCDLTGLMKLGERIGADVPFCVMGGTALAEGRGEILTPLRPLEHCYIVAVNPRIDISTKYVYEHLDMGSDLRHPDIDGMRAAIEKEDLCGIADRMGNVLESVTVREYPLIGELKKELTGLGALNSLMSGSGSTVFGIFDDERTAGNGFEEIGERHPDYQVFLTSTSFSE